MHPYGCISFVHEYENEKNHKYFIKLLINFINSIIIYIRNGFSTE